MVEISKKYKRIALPQRRKERKEFLGFIPLSFSLRPSRLCGEKHK
jgi:hypothetical protein